MRLNLGKLGFGWVQKNNKAFRWVRPCDREEWSDIQPR